MSKTVKVASSRWNEPREYVTDATTWGALKSELGEQILNFEGSPMKAVLRGQDGTRNTLVDNNTLLPQGDFAILLVPEKVKSGDNLVYSTAVLKDMRTKFNRILDFMIEATVRGGEMVFEDDALEDSVEVPVAATAPAPVVDPLILEARELAGE